MLRGYSLPRSPEGRSSLVPAPPWHYVGDFLVIEYWAAPDGGRGGAAPGLEPHPDPGRSAALFVDWQSCSDSGAELDDPIRSQYKEFFVVVNALLDGEPVTTCPYIWVDRDFALVRGWVQGFPKKLGSIHMTRHFPLGSNAGPALAAGGRFAGTLAANDRRLAFGAVTLERESGRGPDAQRSAARERAPLPAPRGGSPRGSGRARARASPQPRPLDFADLGRTGRARALSRRPARSWPPWRRCAWAKASASRSPTRSTTSRPCGTTPALQVAEQPSVSRGALVTGGGTGIGAAIARRLVADGYVDLHHRPSPRAAGGGRCRDRRARRFQGTPATRRKRSRRSAWPRRPSAGSTSSSATPASGWAGAVEEQSPEGLGSRPADEPDGGVPGCRAAFLRSCGRVARS